MYKRFFAFGCSFTNFIWHTWADIIAFDLKIPFYNLGISGLGNVGIASQVIEADLKFNFNKDDLIIILWSSWNREDRVNDSNNWLAGGNIFNNGYYDKYYLKKYFNFTESIRKNSDAIISTNKIYKDKISFQGHIINPGYADYGDDFLFTGEEKKLFDFYSNHFPIDNIFPITPYLNINDQHPRIASHLNYVKNYIYPSINLKLKQETKSNFILQDNKIEMITGKWETLTFKALEKIIKKHDSKIKINSIFKNKF